MNSTTPPIQYRLSGLALGSAVVVSLLFVGCGRRPIVVQAPPPTVIQAAPAPLTVAAPAPAPSQVIMVKEAPPPPRTEPMPPPPSNDYVWVPGYWAYRNGQQSWVPGRWELPPRSGATWVPSRWERQGDSYVFVQGYWQ